MDFTVFWGTAQTFTTTRVSNSISGLKSQPQNKIHNYCFIHGVVTVAFRSHLWVFSFYFPLSEYKMAA